MAAGTFSPAQRQLELDGVQPPLRSGADALEFKRIRELPHTAFSVGNQLWQSLCGRYRVRHVRRVYDSPVTNRFDALVRREVVLAVTNRISVQWEVISSHRGVEAAEDSCRRHAREANEDQSHGD